MATPCRTRGAVAPGPVGGRDGCPGYLPGSGACLPLASKLTRFLLRIRKKTRRSCSPETLVLATQAAGWGQDRSGFAQEAGNIGKGQGRELICDSSRVPHQAHQTPSNHQIARAGLSVLCQALGEPSGEAQNPGLLWG